MLDIWLMGCFIYPFMEMILRTIIETIKSDKKETGTDGTEQDVGTQDKAAAEQKEQGEGEKARPGSRQPSGRRVAPLVIQVESREGEMASLGTSLVAARPGSSVGRVGTCRAGFLQTLKRIGELRFYKL
jgi:hypothetical protein